MWIGGHVRAQAFFGGVTQIIVPDNLKQGVKRTCRYEPDLNPTYLEMAQHYGVAVIPARVRKPRDYPEDLQIPNKRVASLDCADFYAYSCKNFGIIALIPNSE